MTAWDVHLSDETKRAILSVSERLVATAYQNAVALDLRPPRHVDESESDLRDRHVGEFSDTQIRRHVRHARETVFGAFDTGCAANTTYPDSRFNELQALMALCRCGTPQGQSRMENFFGDGYTPHGDTHLRTVKNYSQAQIQAGFEQSIENLLDAVNHLQILQPPVTVAIDITTWPYHAEDELPSEVSGTDESGERAYKFATLSLVGKSMPIVLAVKSVIESSAWDENVPHQVHRMVRRLVRRAQEFVAVVGKPRTFETDTGAVNVSIQPEWVPVVDEPTRNQWVVETAERTIEQIERFDDPENEYARMAREQYDVSIETFRQDAIEALVHLKEPGEAGADEEASVPEPSETERTAADAALMANERDGRRGRARRRG